MSEETKIDVDELLPRIENLNGVISRAEVAAAIRQLRARCHRLQATVEDTARSLKVVSAELDKAAVELAAERERADSADAALAESDAVWRHSVAESRRALVAEHEKRVARLTERAEKAEADVLRERQAAYHARQQCDAARKAFDEKREECDELRSCAHGAIAEDYDAACELLYGSGYNQLAKRVAELVVERDWLRDELADAEHRVEAVVQGEFAWVAKSELERLRKELAEAQAKTKTIGDVTLTTVQLAGIAQWLRAERPTMDALPWQKHDPDAMVSDGSQWLVAVPLKCGSWSYAVVTVHCDEDSLDVTEADETYGWDWYDIEWVVPITEHFSPLAADGNAPATPESAEGPRWPVEGATFLGRYAMTLPDKTKLDWDLWTRGDRKVTVTSSLCQVAYWRHANEPVHEESAIAEARRRAAKLTAGGPPDDLSAACVDDVDIRRGEGRDNAK